LLLFVAFTLSDENEQGSTAIYAITDFFEPFAAGGPEKAMKVELEQGKKLADAAAKTSTLKHLIWSTLPNGRKISNGKYVVPHFDAKNKIDDYIKSKADLYAKTTFLWVTFYAQNYQFPMYTPNLLVSHYSYIDGYRTVLILNRNLQESTSSCSQFRPPFQLSRLGTFPRMLAYSRPLSSLSPN
jgi:hypothetical protein